MGSVWDRTAEFVSDNLTDIYPFALYAIFLPMTLSGALNNVQDGTDAGMAVEIGFGLVGISLSLVVLWGQLAVTALAIDPARSSRNAAITARGRLIPAIVVAVVLLAALFVLMLPMIIAFAMSGIDPVAWQQGLVAPPDGGTLGFVALYGLFVLLPILLFLAARLLVTTPVIVGEGLMVSAIVRAFRLTAGTTWRIIGVLILYAIVYGVAALAAQTVFGTIFELIAGGEGRLTLATVLTSVVVAFVETILTVLAAVFTAKLYLALRQVPAAPPETA